MKSKRLMEAIGDIENKYIQEAEPSYKESYTKNLDKRPYRLGRLPALALSLVLVLAMGTIFVTRPAWLGNIGNQGKDQSTNENLNTSHKSSQGGTEIPTKNGYPIDRTMVGLPVENFSLGNLEENDMSMDRMAFTDFGSIFKSGIDNFAVVKVGKTEKTETNTDPGFDRQVSKVRIIQNLYGDGQVETLKISQSIIKDHFCLGTTNLLRKGGVYILPLRQHSDYSYISADMDVLFEVDNKGRVWSHSDYVDFNQYDGKDLGYFIDGFEKMISDDDFLLANSLFSETLEGWTLADITILDKSDILSSQDGQYYNYSFRLNEVFSEPANPNSDQLGAEGKIMIYGDDDKEIKLKPLKRYLIYLDPFDGKIYTNHRMIAEIENDDIIKALPANDSNSYLGDSIFTPYDSYSLGEIRDLISRIQSWKESNL